ncbi:TonB-dependent receptor [Pontibacter diazotrophicus]|uniref:TonB-dependent receptor n=1 Tax=Pontibacter diazotrophicus TaxID=1400979 RepID=A0A3D8L115_9BACT|nr:TonB-dependent receptor [Pontibacter diazotrophicus]RDV10702.1 TonB-dependent receptor [Pontibacter diazotrophicus]
MNKRLVCLGIGWLTVVFTVLAQTNPLDRKVSISRSIATIQEVLTELSERYGIPFSYGNDLVPLQQQVSIKAEDQPLCQVLDKLLQNTNTRYTLIGSQIILQPVKHPVNRKKKEQFTISGHVRDATSGENLAGVTVSDGTAGTATNAYGFYSLSVPAGTNGLQVRYLGYAPLALSLPSTPRDTVLTLLLQPLSNEIQELIVVAEKVTDLQQANRLTMHGSEVKQLPRLMGEADAIKAIQLMPGVQAGLEGSSDLVVRGGSPDQNLILLDGVPVYNVSHLLGLFSVFNPDAIKTVDLIKGGFPAPYGGRLSSVVDVQLKEGNNQQFSGEGAVGLISSKILLEGPIKNEKTSFLLAARRTYLDLLAAAGAAMSGETISNYNFYDLNAKVNHTFSPTDRVYLSLYAGQDKFSDKQEYQNLGLKEEENFSMRWGNSTSSLRWNHIYGPRLFSNITLTHTRYGFGQQSESKLEEGSRSIRRSTDYSSSIQDWGAKADFDYLLHARHSIRFGGSYTNHRFRPESVTLQTDTLTLTTDSFSQIRAQEFYTYAEDRIQLSERLQAQVGLHFSGFAVNGAFYKSLQPRLGLGYTSATGISVRASYATMAQYLHLISNTATGTPTDIWVPATDKVKPQRSWQATLGAATVLAQQWELTSDVYYKKMQDVAEFREGANFINDFLSAGPETNFANFVAPPYETRLVRGKGWSYGSEWMLRKRTGKTTGWLGYTLAWSWRQLDSVNLGQKYPYTYDSRHSISLVANHQLTEKLSIGGSWQYHTGFVTTLPAASYKAYNEPVRYEGYSGNSNIENVDYLGERNNYRMPAYHRLDLSLTHTKKKKWGERSWNISVYNAYNRKNPFFLRLSRSLGSNVSGIPTRGLYQVSLFPVLPSFSYGFKF